MFQTTFQRIFIAVSLVFFSLGVQAKTVSNKGQFQYYRGYIIFSGHKPRVYLLKNISDQRVLVDKERRHDPGASAGWASMMVPGYWSAILINEPNFKMNCMAKTRRNAFQKVCCKRWVDVVPIKKFSASDSLLKGGSFWIAENKSKTLLKKRMKERGFHLN